MTKTLVEELRDNGGKHERTAYGMAREIETILLEYRDAVREAGRGRVATKRVRVQNATGAAANRLRTLINASAASRIEELEKAMEGLVDDLERRHRQVAEVCDEMQQQANDGYSYHRLVGKQAAYHHAAELAYQALSYKG